MTTRSPSRWLVVAIVFGLAIALVAVLVVQLRDSEDESTSPTTTTNTADPTPEPTSVRKAEIVRREANEPWPDPASEDPGAAAIGQIAQAYASYLEGDPATGNQRVDDLYESEFPRPGGPIDKWAGVLMSPVFMRMAVIDEEAKSAMGELQLERVREMVDKYTSFACSREEAAGDPWSGDGSENHNAVRKTNCLLAAYELGLDDYPLWREHLKEWLQERAKNGLHDEIHSPVYEKYTIASVYNLADFPGDEDIRRLAKQYLDLFWHDMAHDYNDIALVQGASGSRAYQPDPDAGGAVEFEELTHHWSRSWLYMYGWHDVSPGDVPPHPIILNAATSSYVPLSISRQLATMDGKHFEYSSRRPGRAGAEAGESHHIRRDVTVTDDYMLGATTYSPDIDRSMSASENVWYSVSINDETADRVIVSGIAGQKFQTENFADYYAINGASNEDVIVAARDNDADNSEGVRISLTEGELRQNFEEDETGWMFTHAGDAYLAMRIPESALDLPTDPQGDVAAIELRDGADVWAPIIVQAAQARDFDGFEDFKNRVRTLPYQYSDGTVSFTSLKGHTYAMARQEEQASVPRIDDREVDTDPAFSYDSPYLTMDWKSLEAQLRGPDGKTVTLDFST